MLGFDLGSCELKLAVWDGKSVKSLVSEPMPENMVKGGVIVSYEAMAELIKTVVKKNRISGKDCAVLLPESLVFLRRVRMPAMTVEQLTINLPYEFRDFLTMDKSKYFYDYAVNSMIADADGKPKEMDLTAATVTKDVISEYRYMFQRAGLKMRVAIPRECAYSNLLRRVEDSADREFCFIDLGHGSTELDIYTGPCFETSRSIDTGLAAADKAIAEAKDIDEHMANVYKRSDHEGAQSLPAALDVYNSIALEIRRAINFYSFNNQQSELNSAWCCGGGAHIPALKDAIAQSVDLELRDVCELLPTLAKGAEDAAAFAAAIGAAIQEAGK